MRGRKLLESNGIWLAFQKIKRVWELNILSFLTKLFLVNGGGGHLWKRVVCGPWVLHSKYGCDNVLNMRRSILKVSTWWKDLVKVCEENNEEPWFDNNVAWRLGCGNEIQFWNHAWINDKPLKERFPHMYLNSQQNVCVVRRVVFGYGSFVGGALGLNGKT